MRSVLQFPTTTLLLLLLTPFLGGAAGCVTRPKGDIDRVRLTSDRPRAGNVYMVRGLFGMFSTGMDELSARLDKAGVRNVVFQDSQTGALADKIAKTYKGSTDHEPLILVGHSLGADDVITVARRLDREKIPVDLIVTIDPTNPDKVPANVRRVVNLYRSNGALDAVPMFRGIALTPEVPNSKSVENYDIRTTRTYLNDPPVDHFSIDNSPKIQDEVVREVLTAAPSREMWLASRRRVPQVTRADGSARHLGR